MSNKFEIIKINKFGCNIVPADTSLLGQAHPEALKYCGPFTNANGAGWWVFPPIDVDITYGKEWKYNVLSEYPHAEIEVLEAAANTYGSRAIRADETGKSMIGIHDLPKTKFVAGQVEPDIFQFWTGCIFRMPPGWSLLVVDPFNIAQDRPFRAQNAILEVDWLRVDHWLNFKWQRPYEWANIRINQKEPIAQLIPIPREAYAPKWEIVETSTLDEQTFREWDDYYYSKFVSKMPDKDPTTYHRTRKEKSKCPFGFK